MYVYVGENVVACVLIGTYRQFLRANTHGVIRNMNSNKSETDRSIYVLCIRTQKRKESGKRRDSGKMKWKMP